MVIKEIIKWFYNIPAKYILKHLWNNSKILCPGEIQNVKYMSIGDSCYIKNNFRLQAIKISDIDPCFIMGEGSYINRFCQIVIIRKVEIGKRVTIADNVYIADTTHGFKDVRKPISSQPLEYMGNVYIGDGSWIGRSVSIMGCKIGKHCVIGTGAFVTKDIPDYCVVVGTPARIIKRYNFDSKQWQKTDKEGNFI